MSKQDQNLPNERHLRVFYRFLVNIAAIFFIFLIFVTEPLAENCNFQCKDCNVVLLSFDTLRADALGTYGNERPVSPTIDSLAEESVVFERAYSTSPKTAPSHMSMFTGLAPTAHGVTNLEVDQQASKAGVWANRVSEKTTMLAELFKQSGYKTVGFHGGGFLEKEFGFNRGFDIYRYAENEKSAIDWIGWNKNSQFFLFFHTYLMHDPYLVPEEYVSRFSPDYKGRIIGSFEGLEPFIAALKEKGADHYWSKYEAFWERVDKDSPSDIKHLRALYDTQVLFADRMVDNLLSALKPLREKTVVIILSDHGEEFKEHGRFLHEQLYDEVLHVPLIINSPSCKLGQRIQERVSLQRLAFTIAELVGLPKVRQFQGPSLLSSAGTSKQWPILSEYLLAGRKSLIVGDEKLITKGDPKKTLANVWGEYYNLREDPRELKDLGFQTPGAQQIFESLRRVNRDNLSIKESFRDNAGSPKQKKSKVSDKTLDKLRSLGYIK